MTTIQRQLRRGTTSQIGAMTPAVGELIYDTARKGLAVGDGATAGGHVVVYGYEEGTFTPALEFSGSAVGLTYSSRSASYTKIGNRILAEININLTSKGSSTGSAKITGLPFALNGPPFSIANVWVFAMGSGISSPAGWLEPSTSLINLTNLSAGGIAAIADTDFTDTSQLFLTISYRI